MNKEGWKYKKLNDVCTVKDGTHDSPKYIEQGYPLVTSKNLRGGILDMDNVQFISQEDYDKINIRSKVDKGDILFAMIGTIGNPVLVEEEPNFAIKNMALLKPSASINKKYLLFYMGSPAVLNKMQKEAKGGTQKFVALGYLRDFIIPVPPLSDQEAIVAELDLLSSVIEKQKKQLEELDTLAQSIFYDMFGDPVENEKGWEVKKLSEIVSDDCSISYGIVQPGDGVEDGVPVVRPVDMTGTFVYRNGLKQTTKEISESYKRTILKGNEIFMCVRGTTGLVALATEELKGCNVTRGVTPIECNEHCNKYFVYYQFMANGVQQYVAEHTRGIALKQINMADVRTIPLFLPPLSLQQAFAEKIQAIEAQKASVKAAMADTQRLFDYTMDKYFG